MPGRIQPTTIVKEITTQTTQGEVTVNLNISLTIDINEFGEVSVGMSKKGVVDDIPDYIAQIPDIETVSENDLIDFGKDIK